MTYAKTFRDRILSSSSPRDFIHGAFMCTPIWERQVFGSMTGIRVVVRESGRFVLERYIDGTLYIDMVSLYCIRRWRTRREVLDEINRRYYEIDTFEKGRCEFTVMRRKPLGREIPDRKERDFSNFLMEKYEGA